MPHHQNQGPVRLSSQLGQQVTTFEPQPNVGGLGIMGDQGSPQTSPGPGSGGGNGAGPYYQQQSLVSRSPTQPTPSEHHTDRARWVECMPLPVNRTEPHNFHDSENNMETRSIPFPMPIFASRPGAPTPTIAFLNIFFFSLLHLSIFHRHK